MPSPSGSEDGEGPMDISDEYLAQSILDTAYPLSASDDNRQSSPTPFRAPVAPPYPHNSLNRNITQRQGHITPAPLLRNPPFQRTQPAEASSSHDHASPTVSCGICSRSPVNSGHHFRVIIPASSTKGSDSQSKPIVNKSGSSTKRRSARISGSVNSPNLRDVESSDQEMSRVKGKKIRMESATAPPKAAIQQPKPGPSEKRTPAILGSATSKTKKATTGASSSMFKTPDSSRIATGPSNRRQSRRHDHKPIVSGGVSHFQTASGIKTSTATSNKKRPARPDEGIIISNLVGLDIVKSDININDYVKVGRKLVRKAVPSRSAGKVASTPITSEGNGSRRSRRIAANQPTTAFLTPPAPPDIPTPRQQVQRRTPPRLNRRTSTRTLCPIAAYEQRHRGGSNASDVSTPTASAARVRAPRTVAHPPQPPVNQTPYQEPEARHTPPRMDRRTTSTRVDAQDADGEANGDESSIPSSVSTPTAGPRPMHSEVHTPTHQAVERQAPPRVNRCRKPPRVIETKDVDDRGNPGKSRAESGEPTPTATSVRAPRTATRVPPPAPPIITPTQPRQRQIPPRRERRRRATRVDAGANQNAGESSTQSSVSTPTVAQTARTRQPRNSTDVWDAALEAWSVRNSHLSRPHTSRDEEPPSGHETLTEVDENDEVEPDSWSGYE